MLKDIKAAIFDLDGTLIDSMWIWERIDVEYLNDKGFDMPENLKDEINHLSFQETAYYFKKTFNLDDSIDTILETWHNMALKNYSESVKLKDGALELLQHLKKSGIKIGLATSNSTTLLEAGLHCVGIYDYFDAITTTGETKKGKNNPDVYLLAANKLGTSPNECIVFEDILEAVKGAKLANMKVVAIYDKSAEYQQADLRNIADKYIINFHEIL